MKPLLIIIVSLLTFQVGAQNLISANPARLQVYLMTSDSNQVMLTLNELNNQYNQLNMLGTLDIKSLMTDDEAIRAVLDSLDIGLITYSTMIPDGQFIFRDTYNYTFTTEAELKIEDRASRFILDFDISNRNTSLANTFAVTCSGTLSLKNDLGINGNGCVQDKVSFQFFQNVRSMTY